MFYCLDLCKYMHQKHIHIISFNIPYPANYGGVIDVFYLLEALNEKGVKIHLHCFEYGREHSKILEQICFRVYYYPRKTGLKSALSTHPYIAKSRQSEELIQNLLKDEHPVLVEGIHNCLICLDKRLKKRFIVFRPANIEHDYYQNLAHAESNRFKKFYFYSEALKLRDFEKKLQNINLILGISEADTKYFKQQFPKTQVVYIPAFHAAMRMNSLTGLGNYAFYHGNLEVAENEEAALFLLKEVFSKINYPLIISGHNPSLKLERICRESEYVQLIKNPDDDSLFRLIQNAHIHVLPSFQASGFKLKLIHTLFNGRHLVTNKKMLNGTPFESICHMAENASSWIEQIERLAEMPFSKEDQQKRKEILFPHYYNSANAEKIIHLIFDFKQ